jgi:hypothetical protein
MKWAHFLHIYQPSDQHPGILDKIVNESYRPLLRGLMKTPQAKLTLNINGVLVEMLFEHGYRDVIDSIKDLIEMNRLELTGSAKYHALLPLIPENEARRQITLNEDTLLRYFGRFFTRKGFFSPEMAYSPKVAGIIESMGYEWVLADEVSICGPGEAIKNNKIYQIRDLSLKVYFREKHPSNLIMGALVRSAESFKTIMKDRLKDNEYIVTAMDGETFGHHRPGHEESFFDILRSPDFDNVLISELPMYFDQVEDVSPKDSTWVPSAKEIQEGKAFILWSDKDNKIHGYEWRLAETAIEAVNNSKYSDENFPQLLEEQKNWDEMTDQEKSDEENKRRWIKSRDMLDKALNSDPWWWASAKPWWSVEMIEKGMNALYKVVLEVPDSSDELKDRAEDLYKRILFTAHEWQRHGIVDKVSKEDNKERSIPLSKRFGADLHYKALLEALKEQEMQAVNKREYEQAIKWRDGQYKLERDLDIYDAVHIMDLFRQEGNFKKFQEILEEYRKKYKEISRGQPE